MKARATDILQDSLLIDGHIDLPNRLFHFRENPAGRTIGGDFDYPRAREGGLDVAFMAAYVPTHLQSEPDAAKSRADELIDRVERIAETPSSQFSMVTSPDDARRIAGTEAVGCALGLENGAAIEHDLENLRHFVDRGIRYITITHTAHNHLADSSGTDDPPRWDGLSPFGEDVIAEMNRLGVMVDVSHTSDAVVRDILNTTSAPVIASHSGCRHYTANWPRNLSDELIEGVAATGGVVMIPFGSRFLRTAYRDRDDTMKETTEDRVASENWGENSRNAVVYRQEMRRGHPVGTVADVADHIDRIATLVGIDHVGLGSDFDGVFSLPSDLQDVSDYPNLVAELLRRDYSPSDLEKILGQNLLRVWTEADAAAQTE